MEVLRGGEALREVFRGGGECLDNLLIMLLRIGVQWAGQCEDDTGGNDDACGVTECKGAETGDSKEKCEERERKPGPNCDTCCDDEAACVDEICDEV